MALKINLKFELYVIGVQSQGFCQLANYNCVRIMSTYYKRTVNLPTLAKPSSHFLFFFLFTGNLSTFIAAVVCNNVVNFRTGFYGVEK